jgi:hypothetical protein
MTYLDPATSGAIKTVYPHYPGQWTYESQDVQATPVSKRFMIHLLRGVAFNRSDTVAQTPLEKEMSQWHETGVSVVCELEIQMQLVGKLFTFRNPQEVSEFLHAHPFLVPLLVEAHDRIAHYFEPSPEVVLEVITDPEAEDDHELFVFIRTALPPDEAIRKLDWFDQEWWLEASPRAKCLLNIDVEYA